MNPRLIIEAQRGAGDLGDKEVALTLGATGSFKDLSVLGMRGEIVIDEALTEDLIIFLPERWAPMHKLQPAMYLVQPIR